MARKTDSLKLNEATPRKIPLIFYRSRGGAEPVREWLKSLSSEDRQVIGLDLGRVQYRWPIGMPLCKPMGRGLWEVRTALSNNRIARVLFFALDGEIWALHGFIKKTAKTPPADLMLAHQRMKEIKR